MNKYPSLHSIPVLPSANLATAGASDSVLLLTSARLTNYIIIIIIIINMLDVLAGALHESEVISHWLMFGELILPHV